MDDIKLARIDVSGDIGHGARTSSTRTLDGENTSVLSPVAAAAAATPSSLESDFVVDDVDDGRSVVGLVAIFAGIVSSLEDFNLPNNEAHLTPQQQHISQVSAAVSSTLTDSPVNLSELDEAKATRPF
jgi:hypothetical protein